MPAKKAEASKGQVAIAKAAPPVKRATKADHPILTLSLTSPYPYPNEDREVDRTSLFGAPRATRPRVSLTVGECSEHRCFLLSLKQVIPLI